MRTIVTILIATVISVSCQSERKNNAEGQPAVAVQVKTPVVPDGDGYFTASGAIESENFASLSTRMMGYVSKVYVSVGDKVQKGQLLIDINSDEIDAKKAQALAGLSQAEAQLAVAEKDFQRYEKLYSESSASQKEFDDMTLQYEMARANHERAKQVEKEIDAHMAYSHIRAPFSGVITSKSIKMGDMAKPGQPLMSLEAPGKFEANVMVPETSIEHVEKGQKVTVYIKSSGKSVQGTVSEVSKSSLNSGGQYLVKIELPKTGLDNLFSGMYVSAVFPVSGQGSKKVFVDRNAILTKGELDGIYTVSESGTAILRWLKLGQEIGEQVEVLSGISEGEEYIVSAEGKLYNGVKITKQ